MRSQAEKLSFCAVFTAFGLLLSYVEAILPINLIIPIPGFKLGLASLAVLYTFFTLGLPYAAAVSMCRVSLSAMLFGSVTSFAFSLAGSLLSLGVIVLYKVFLNKFNGIIGMSVLCAAMHNLGQCIVCAIMFDHYVLTFYLPYLLLFSLITGSITGFLASKYPKLKIFQKGKCA